MVQKLTKNALQNKIGKDLFIIGKNSIIEVFDNSFNNFDSLIVPTSSKSEKIDEIVKMFNKKRIPVYKDSTLLDFAKNSLQVDSAGVIVLLIRPMEKYLSLRQIKPMIELLDSCTVVALPDVEYEQNLGAMIRTCLGLDVDLLLVPNRQQKVFSSTVTKVSMGYNHVLPIVRENFLLAIEELKQMGFQIVGLDGGGENIVNFRYNPKVCIIMGNESDGLSNTVMRKCDTILSIPINNVVESLNVSVALTIALYDRLSKTNETKR